MKPLYKLSLLVISIITLLFNGQVGHTCGRGLHGMTLFSIKKAPDSNGSVTELSFEEPCFLPVHEMRKCFIAFKDDDGIASLVTILPMLRVMYYDKAYNGKPNRRVPNEISEFIKENLDRAIAFYDQQKSNSSWYDEDRYNTLKSLRERIRRAGDHVTFRHADIIGMKLQEKIARHHEYDLPINSGIKEGNRGRIYGGRTDDNSLAIHHKELTLRVTTPLHLLDEDDDFNSDDFCAAEYPTRGNLLGLIEQYEASKNPNSNNPPDWRPPS